MENRSNLVWRTLQEAYHSINRVSRTNTWTTWGKNTTSRIQCSPAEFITRFSTQSRLQTIAAYCLRFAHSAINPSLRRTGYLTSTELRDSLHVCIKIAQQETYTQDINDLCKKGQLPLARVTVTRPFLSTGIDNVGLFEINNGNTRSKTTELLSKRSGYILYNHV